MKKEKKKIKELGYYLFRPFIVLFAFLVGIKPKIHYKNRLPKKEGYIFAGTHTSKYDFITAGCTTRRAMHFLSKKELTDIKGLKWLFSFVGLIRVDRQSKNPDATLKAVEALKEDKIICVFPEGTINKTKDYIMPFKYGPVSFAIKSGKPIVPFAIIGKAKPFKKRPHIYIGEPYYVKSDDMNKEIKILENKVIELIKEGKNE